MQKHHHQAAESSSKTSHQHAADGTASHHHSAHAGGAGQYGAGHASAVFVDPVCGMSVAADTLHQVEHGGKLHRFCSAGCLRKFQSEPTRYLEGEPAHTTSAASNGVDCLRITFES